MHFALRLFNRKHCHHYEVKGYHFLAHHWSDKNYNELVDFSQKLKDRGVLKEDQPLFVLTHSVLTARPRGHLSKNFSTGINLFGHWHTPHTNANFAVRSEKSRMKSVEVPCSRKDCPTRHGYIVKVYEKWIVFECWDFSAKRKVMPDWVMPISPARKPKGGQRVISTFPFAVSANGKANFSTIRFVSG